jgi:endonuclease G
MNLPFEMKQTAPWSRMLRLTAILALTVASTAHARLSVFEALDSASGHPTRFAQCPQFFANGKPPVIPARPKLRDLCYEAFAVLHSGETKTPVYVAQRLNSRIIEDADEKRTTKFFNVEDTRHRTCRHLT